MRSIPSFVPSTFSSLRHVRVSPRCVFVWFAMCTMMAGLAPSRSASHADEPLLAWKGKAADDARLRPLKDLNGYFPFVPPKTRQQWAIRAEKVRRQMLVTQGLWPEPERTALNATVHSRLERAGYTMESVYFEAVPGFHVTGTLYRPAGAVGEAKGSRPAVLCPHGHWPNGRFMDRGEAGAEKMLKSGAESMLTAARNPLQARCVQLARMGCVVFHYDMIGYADSQQISFELAHKFAKQRPNWNDPADWGFFSPQAESRFQSIMGMQTWTSIRAVDFVLSLPDVDAERVAVTGASGGGTQSFMLAALDPRIAVAAPAVMVSTAMQGGCTCENASGLRIETGNVEFAALFAPKPLGLTAADDWTEQMATKGFPELKQLYGMLDAEDNVALWANIQFPHNYNSVSRREMYKWFNKHLKLGVESVDEQDYPFATEQELTVYRNGHARPEGGPALEHRVVRWLTDAAERKMEAAKDPKAWRNLAGPAIDTVIGRELPAAADLAYEQTAKAERDNYVEVVGELIDTSRREKSPVLFLYPKQWNGHVVIWLDEQGKAGVYQAGKGAQLKPEIQKLINGGVSVASIDLFQQGEFLMPKSPKPQRTRKVANPREAAAYTFGYNHSLMANRVHDVLKMIAFVLNHEYQPKRVSLIGWQGRAGIWAAAARAQARDLVDDAVIHTRGFRFANVTDIHSPDFLPGGAKYGDVPGMLAVSGAKVLLAGESDEAWIRQRGGRVTRVKPNGKELDQAIDRLLSGD